MRPSNIFLANVSFQSKIGTSHDRPFSRRIQPPPPAGNVWRHRRSNNVCPRPSSRILWAPPPPICFYLSVCRVAVICNYYQTLRLAAKASCPCVWHSVNEPFACYRLAYSVSHCAALNTSTTILLLIQQVPLRQLAETLWPQQQQSTL